MAGPASPSRAAARWRTSCNLAGPLLVLAGEALFLLPWIWAGLMAGAAARPARRAAGLAKLAAVLAGAAADRAVRRGGAVVAPGAVPLGGARLPVPVPAARRRTGAAGRGPPGAAAPRRRRHRRPAGRRAAGQPRPSCAGTGWAPSRPGFDPGLQALDWTPAARRAGPRGLLHRPGTVIAGTSWWVTGKLDYALGGDPPVICLNTDAREYGLAPGPAAHLGQDVLLLGPTLDRARAQQAYGRLFDSDRGHCRPPSCASPAGRPAALPLFLGHRLRAWP